MYENKDFSSITTDIHPRLKLFAFPNVISPQLNLRPSRRCKISWPACTVSDQTQRYFPPAVPGSSNEKITNSRENNIQVLLFCPYLLLQFVSDFSKSGLAPLVFRDHSLVVEPSTGKGVKVVARIDWKIHSCFHFLCSSHTSLRQSFHGIFFQQFLTSVWHTSSVVEVVGWGPGIVVVGWGPGVQSQKKRKLSGQQDICRLNFPDKARK